LSTSTATNNPPKKEENGRVRTWLNPAKPLCENCGEAYDMKYCAAIFMSVSSLVY